MRNDANKRQFFALLFEASAAALLEVAADPRYLGKLKTAC
jgi:hypothetical protein